MTKEQIMKKAYGPTGYVREEKMDRFEEIKANHGNHLYMGDYKDCYVCWLIAEVERLRRLQGNHCACRLDEGGAVVEWCGEHAPLRDEVERLTKRCESIRPTLVHLKHNDVNSLDRENAEKWLEGEP